MRRDAPASFPLATALLALACLAAGLVELAPQFAYDRAGILAGEIWRLWTGHLVHFSAQQLVVDVSALLLAGWLVERERGTGFTAGVVLLGMPAISIALLLASPQLHEYRGASGVVVLLALVATTSMWMRHPGTRPALLLLGVALAVKTVIDATGGPPGLSSLPPGVRVAWQAHVAGAVFGWLAACHGRRRLAHARAAPDTVR